MEKAKNAVFTSRCIFVEASPAKYDLRLRFRYKEHGLARLFPDSHAYIQCAHL